MNGRIWGVDRHNTYKAMMKKLLSASLFAAVALSVSAYEIDQYAYTFTAKYKITGANLVQNGKFEGATGLENWTATADSLPAASTFMTISGGPNGSNSIQVQTGMNSLSHGIYQKIEVAQGGTYVVSLKVKGALAGLTDLDMTGGNTNYINAYWNTDGALATVSGTSLYYGTNSNVVNEDGTFGNGVCGGYGFSFGAENWTEAVFAVEAPANGYVIIDLRGLADGLEIANVECHAAEQVYDDRIARERIAYFNKYLTDEALAEREYYEDFQFAVADVVEGLEAGKSPEEMSVLMESLEGVWDEFVGENFENLMDLINGGEEAGNKSANWMYWTGKYNKLNSEYQGKDGMAPWTWSTDRWCHKTAAAGNPMRIEWNGKWANSTWNNIATLTYTLRPGTYFWGVSAYGGPGTLNKARWAASTANPCAETKLFFNGDTILIDTLNTARREDYVLQFTLEEEKEVTFGIICNNVSPTDTYGFYANFYDPTLYKLKNPNELTEEERIYLANVGVQLDALAGRIDVANGYCDAANDTLPWGKEALAAGAAEAQALYDEWAALDTTTILEEWMYNDLNLPDTIMNNGVRFLNNNYITPFLNMNAPFPNLLASIDAAEVVKARRIYASSTKMDDLTAEISNAKAMYAEKLKVAFSSADSIALDNQKIALDELVIAFKAAISGETIVDIDFGTQEAPAVFTLFEDPEGLMDAYYYVLGAKDTLKTTTVATTVGTTSFEIGYGSANGADGLAARTDSLGMLRIGNGEAVVTFSGAPIKPSDIVNIKFDMFYGNLSGKFAGFKVLSEAGDTICVFYLNRYNGVINEGENTLGIDKAYVTGVGSSSASNAAIASIANNKTSFDIVLDYGAKTMYCTTTCKNGSSVSVDVPLPDYTPGQFVVYSNYNNADRRSWLDNLKVLNYAAEPYSAIESIEAVKPVGNDLMYNIMGQQILKPVKGQIYIQNGVKKIGK